MADDRTVSDTSWVTRALLVPLGEKTHSRMPTIRRRYSTSAAFKFTSSRVGSNFAINNPPQFTRWADIRSPPRGAGDDEWVMGQGSYYSEAFDDTAQVVHMAFGNPLYNTMTSFIGNFYDSHTALLANTGKVSSFFYNAGDITGFIATLPFQPFIYAGKMAIRVLDFLQDKGGSKWYYFKPAMHNYWSAVNSVANTLAINIGIAPRVMEGPQASLADSGALGSREAASMLNQWFPDLFRPEGGIDVMNLSRSAQRKADYFQEQITEKRERAGTKEELEDATLSAVTSLMTDPAANASTNDLFRKYAGSPMGRANGSGGAEENGDDEDSNVIASLKSAMEFARASQRDGSQFVTFRVNHKPTFTESFSNSTRESNIAQKLNSQVSSARNLRFDAMEGNITGMMGQFTDAMKSFTGGLLDSVGIGGLAALAGSAYADIPKVWDGSTANLPRAEYTIPLYCARGDKLSRFLNLMLPISMILPAALPLTTGKASYTSPFLCQIYHKGRVQCKLGMIDSLTITRGTGNIGWNTEDEMLGAEISFSVVDMSSIMHVPIRPGFSSNSIRGKAGELAAGGISQAAFGNAGYGAIASGVAFDEESVFQDYLGVIGGLDVTDSYYRMRRLNLNMSYANAHFRNWTSPTNFMSWLLDGGSARMLSAFAQTSDRFNKI